MEDYRELVNEHPIAKSYSITDTVILESDTESKIYDKLENEFLKIQDFIDKSRGRKSHPNYGGLKLSITSHFIIQLKS